MATLREMLAQQQAKLAQSDAKFASYHSHGAGSRPWDGFWGMCLVNETPADCVAPLRAPADVRAERAAQSGATDSVTAAAPPETTDVERAKRKHRLARYDCVSIFLKQAGDSDRVEGVWYDGEGRFLFDGTLSDSRAQLQGATLRDAYTGRLLTPVSLRMGHGRESALAIFTWSSSVAVPPPDAGRLARVFPRVIAVTCVVETSDAADTDEDPSRLVVRRLIERCPGHFAAAPVTATSAVVAKRYAMPRPAADGAADEAPRYNFTPARHEALQAVIDANECLTHHTAPDGNIAVCDVYEAHRVLASSGRTLLLPADVRDVTLLRAAQYHCGFAQLHIVGEEAIRERFRTTNNTQATLAQRTIDGFPCLEGTFVSPDEAVATCAAEIVRLAAAAAATA